MKFDFLVFSSASLLEVTKLNFILDLQLDIRVGIHNATGHHVAVRRLVDRNGRVLVPKSILDGVVSVTMFVSRDRRPREDVLVVICTQLVLRLLFGIARLCLCQALVDILQGLLAGLVALDNDYGSDDKKDDNDNDRSYHHHICSCALFFRYLYVFFDSDGHDLRASFSRVVSNQILFFIIGRVVFGAIGA